MTGRQPHADLVRYAFGLQTEARLYFGFPLVEGAAPPVGDRSNLPLHTFLTTRDGPQAFNVRFEGLVVLVTTFDPASVDMREIYEGLPTGAVVVDRPRNLVWSSVSLRIRLDWHDDPDAAAIFDAEGVPVSRRR